MLGASNGQIKNLKKTKWEERQLPTICQHLHSVQDICHLLLTPSWVLMVLHSINIICSWRPILFTKIEIQLSNGVKITYLNSINSDHTSQSIFLNPYFFHLMNLLCFTDVFFFLCMYPHCNTMWQITFSSRVDTANQLPPSNHLLCILSSHTNRLHVNLQSIHKSSSGPPAWQSSFLPKYKLSLLLSHSLPKTRFPWSKCDVPYLITGTKNWSNSWHWKYYISLCV